MNKKLIVLAVAAAVAAPMAAMADATIYGKVRIGLEYNTLNEVDAWDMKSYSSRLGLKGSEDLGNGLSAIYQLEFGVNPVDANDDINDGDRGNITYRNTFVGLSGGWGTGLIGRHDTPLKMSTASLDLFADTAADMNDTVGFDDVRVDNTVAYISPNMSGFTLAAALVPAGGSTAVGGFNPEADSLADAWSLAAIYANGPWNASLAYENMQEEIVAPLSQNEFTKWRLGLGMLGYNNFSVTGIYENWDAGTDADSDLWQLQAAYDFGNTRIKAMYGQNDSDASILDKDTWAIGLQHNLSKRTDAQVLYTQTDTDAPGDLGDREVFAVQMNHSF